MGRLQRTIGILLVVGLLAGSAIGFAAAQAGKSVTPFITATDFTHATWFSPTCACPTSTARFSVTAAGAPAVGVQIVRGDNLRPVRMLAANVSTAHPIVLVWDGRTDAGKIAGDGAYRAQVLFPKQRTRTLLDQMHLDTRPPSVTASLPAGAVLPATGAAAYRYRVTADEAATATATVYRVEADGSVAQVWRQPAPTPAVPGAAVQLTWAGQRRNPAGRARPGVYIVGFDVADRAGNLVRTPQTFTPGALGEAAPVRVQGVDVSLDGNVASPGRGAMAFTVSGISRRGTTTIVRAGSTSARRIPPAPHAGLYVSMATIAGETGSGFDARAGVAHTLLVVPTYTWQAENPYDAAGDGFPDVPPAPLGLGRPLPDASASVHTLIGQADGALRRHREFGAITDDELAAGVPSQVRVLVIAGMRVWTVGVRRAIRRFASDGGHVLFASSPLDRLGIVTGDALVVGAEPRPAGLAKIGRTVS